MCSRTSAEHAGQRMHPCTGLSAPGLRTTSPDEEFRSVINHSVLNEWEIETPALRKHRNLCLQFLSQREFSNSIELARAIASHLRDLKESKKARNRTKPRVTSEYCLETAMAIRAMRHEAHNRARNARRIRSEGFEDFEELKLDPLYDLHFASLRQYDSGCSVHEGYVIACQECQVAILSPCFDLRCELCFGSDVDAYFEGFPDECQECGPYRDCVCPQPSELGNAPQVVQGAPEVVEMCSVCSSTLECKCEDPFDDVDFESELRNPTRVAQALKKLEEKGKEAARMRKKFGDRWAQKVVPFLTEFYETNRTRAKSWWDSLKSYIPEFDLDGVREYIVNHLQSGVNFARKYGTIIEDILELVSLGYILWKATVGGQLDLFAPVLVLVAKRYVGDNYVRFLANLLEGQLDSLKKVATSSTIKAEGFEDYIRGFKSVFDAVIGSKVFQAIAGVVGSLVTMRFFSYDMAKSMEKIFQMPKKATVLDLVKHVLDAITYCTSVIKSLAGGSSITEAFYREEGADIGRLRTLEEQFPYLYDRVPVEGRRELTDFMVELRDLTLRLEASLRHTTQGTERREKFESALVRARALRERVDVKKMSSNRIPPLAMVLYGPPKCGKSMLRDYLCKVHSDVVGRPFSTDLIYDRAPTDFWDGYDPLTNRYVAFGELGADHPKLAAAKGDTRLDDWLSCNSSNGKLLNMAFDKGKVYLCADVFIADTNNPELNARETKFAPAAVMRRGLWIEITVKNEFVVPGTTSLDSSKPDPATGPLDKFWFTVKSNNAISNTQTVPELHGAVMDIFALTLLMKRLFKKHIAQESRLKEEIANGLFDRYGSKLHMEPATGELEEMKEPEPIVIPPVDTPGDVPLVQTSSSNGLSRFRAALNRIRGRSDIHSEGPRFEEKEELPFYKRIPLRASFLTYRLQTSVSLGLRMIARWSASEMMRRIEARIREWINFLQYVAFWVLLSVWLFVSVTLSMYSIALNGWMLGMVYSWLYFSIYGLICSLVYGLVVASTEPVKELKFGAPEDNIDDAWRQLKGIWTWGSSAERVASYAKYAVVAGVVGLAVHAMATRRVKAYSERPAVEQTVLDEARYGLPPVIKRQSKIQASWNPSFRSPPITTQSVAQVDAFARKNLRSVLLTFIQDNLLKTREAMLLGLAGEFALINRHSLPLCDATIRMALAGLAADPDNSHIVEFHVRVQDFVPVGDDGAVFRVPSERFPDIVKYFVQDADRLKEGSCMISGQLTHFVRGTNLDVNNRDEVIKLSEFYRYEADHRPGMCGTPLVAEIKRVGQIIGYHAAGDSLSRKSFSVPLSAPELRIAFSKLRTRFNVDTGVVSESFAVLPAPFPAGPLIDPAPQSPVFYVDMPLAKCMDRDPALPTHVNEKSSLVHLADLEKRVSDFLLEEHGVVVKPKGIPPMRCGWYTVDGVKTYGSPINMFFESATKPQKMIDRNLIDSTVDYLECLLGDEFARHGVAGLAPLSRHQTINGIVEDDYTRRVNAATGTGPYFRGKKGDYLPLQDDGTRWCTTELEEKWDAALDLLDRGEGLASYFECCLKDEVRSEAKNRAFKTRIFQVQGLLDSLLFKQFLSPVLSRLVELATPYGYTVGIDMHREGPRWFADMTSVGKVFDGDWADFQNACPYEVSHAACRVIRHLALRFGYNAAALRGLDGVLSMLLHPRVIWRGTIFELVGVLPSGAWGTTEINCLKNMICFVMFAKRAGVANPLVDVKCAFFGDDQAFGVPPSLRDRVNLRLYQQFARDELGMTLTDAAKSVNVPEFIPPETLSFLKRTRQEHPEMGYACPLELDSLHKMLGWYLPSTAVTKFEQWSSMITAALTEYYFASTREKHARFRATLVDWYVGMGGEACDWPTWDSLTESYC